MSPQPTILVLLAVSMAGLGTSPLAGQLPGPGGLTVAATGATTARVTWVVSGKVLGYQVERYRADNRKAPELTSQPLGVTAQWDDAGLEPGVTYQYVVSVQYPRGSGKASVSLTMPATLSLPDFSAARSNRAFTPRARAGSQPPPPPPLPVMSSLSVSRPYPGQTVTLTGANLSGVTAIRIGVPNPPSPTPSHSQSVPVAAGTISSTGTTVSFQWPMNYAWPDGIQVAMTVTTAIGTSTSGFTVPVDRKAVITRAVKPLARAGMNIELEGRNLDGVTGGYIGAAPVNTVSNPRFTARGGWMGLFASIVTPQNCSREGVLLLEHIPLGAPPGTAPSTIAAEGTPIRGGCGITPTAMTVTPQAGAPGTKVRVWGKGFSWLTGVQVGTTNLRWTPISDIEFDLELPDTPTGAPQTVHAVLLNSVPDPMSSGTFVTPPVVALAPVITSVSHVWAECCENVTLTGRGLANPLGPRPVVKLNGRQVTVTASAPGSATFQVPFPGPNDQGPATITLEHAVGTATAPAPLIVLEDPSAITSISPAVIPAGVPTTVTVRGTNMVRARGICLPGASPTGPFMLRTDPQSTSNTEIQVVVTAAAGLSGPIAVAVPPNINQRQYTYCQANPTPVTITAQ